MDNLDLMMLYKKLYIFIEFSNKLAANFYINIIFGFIEKKKIDIKDFKKIYNFEYIYIIVELIQKNVISFSMSKEIFSKSFEENKHPFDIILKENLYLISEDKQFLYAKIL